LFTLQIIIVIWQPTKWFHVSNCSEVPTRSERYLVSL